MNGRFIIALGLLLLCVAADANKKGPLPRVPDCPKEDNVFCVMPYDPVCGSNGWTYDNECEMCNHLRLFGRLKIVSNGPCRRPGRK